ncbi:unnamed protein product, partial [Rotaria socialis]
PVADCDITGIPIRAPMPAMIGASLEYSGPTIPTMFEVDIALHAAAIAFISVPAVSTI